MSRYLRVISRSLLTLAAFVGAGSVAAFANPYLPKAGEPPIKIRIGTCAITGGFIHLYAALDHRLFEKYGFKFLVTPTT